jgi:hypothetical protein
MPRPTTLTGEGTNAPKPPERFESATVAKAVTAGEDLFVILESLPDQPVGPVKGWSVRTTPAVRGDRLLVARVADGDYWFVAWDIPGWS